ncbi:MAG: AAA-like domain-containing protein [Bacteroidota bacterium]
MFELAHSVKSRIAENDTRGAIEALKEGLEGHPAEKAVLLRAAQNHGLKQEYLTGTLSWSETSLTQNQINNALLAVADKLLEEQASQTRVFISYNRDEASSNLAREIRSRLKAQHFSLFMDVEDTPLGADWALTILHEIQQCDYLIVLLSEKANSSEMVIKEVEIAHKSKSASGRPLVLPIRVEYPLKQRLNARLHSMLHRVQQIEWKDKEDTLGVLKRIQDVLYKRIEVLAAEPKLEFQAQDLVAQDNEAPSPVAPLEIPRGAVRLESKYYIERAQEENFIHNVEAPGAILRIKGPRQFGKTSLLTRVISHAVDKEYQVVAIDFQEMQEETMEDLDTLLKEFCYYFADELDKEEELEKRWKRPRAKKQICTAFIEKDILPSLDKPLLLAIDEADRLFRYKEASKEFFLLLRSWHEKSKVPNKREWENFRLALSYSTEAKLAIQDLNASPFNVGEEAKLTPFTLDQVAELAHRHGLSWGADQLDTLMELLKGQPYLVRRAMYLLARQEYQFPELIEKAALHDGPFSDHLRHHLINLRQFEEVSEAMKGIISKGKCSDPIMAGRLEATGLVKGSHPDIVPANGLYAAYFKGIV